MEQLASKPGAHHAHAHPPFLAHHFDTPEQQYRNAKIGMWILLGTEILMFGGLFLAYAVYRYNYPEIFFYAANKYLSTTMGAINTVVLLTSSLTMALAVRYAQLNRQKALVACLLATLLGGAGFMIIKANEYEHKFHDGVFVSQWLNRYSATYATEEASPLEAPGGLPGTPMEAQPDPQTPPQPTEETLAQSDPRSGLVWVDPNAGTPDEPKIKPNYVAPAGLAAQQQLEHADLLQFETLSPFAQERVYTFFQIYFMMTGLHGIHVIIGMSLIFWITLRSVAPKWRWALGALGPALIGAYLMYISGLAHSQTINIIGIVLLVLAAVWLVGGLMRSRKIAAGQGDFNSEYFTPVDIVGLYWHLVDLIWIFLFPLLYLIH